MSEIRVRFAPSPTGYLHIGSARTALFNWLYARNQGGKFILRIEDTDKERSDEKFLDEILSSLKWLGFNWDEELYFQSKRFGIYRERAEKLVSENKAYYEETEKGKAIRLKVAQNEPVAFYDIVHDKIEVSSSTLNDLVLIKSDQTATYNFACVVDDIDMKMTHIIRGDDHIANTPKQILIYNAFSTKPPKFCHIPLILGEDKSRMSKRHGATSIAEYKNRGYLPEALVNFLALMGWSPKNNQEKLSVEKIIALFSLKGVNKTGAVFNIKKLDWLNMEYIKEKPAGELAEFVGGHFVARGILPPDYDRKWLSAMVECYRTRFVNIDDLVEKTEFLFKEEIVPDPEAEGRYLGEPGQRLYLAKLKDKLEQLCSFEPADIETAVRDLAGELKIEAAQIIHPARVALTGRASAAGIFEVMALLGKERCITRLGKIKG